MGDVHHGAAVRSGYAVAAVVPARQSARVTAETRPAASSWLPHFAILALIWGSSFLFIKVAGEQLPPAYVALIRVALGAATLLIILKAMRDRLPRQARIWAHLAVIALIGNVIPWILFAYGEQQVPSALAGIWNATTPLTLMPVMLLFPRSERLTRSKVIGLLVGFAGVVTVLGIWTGVGTGTLVGDLCCFGAATSYAFVGLYMRQFVTERAESAVALAAGQLLMTTAQLLVIAPLLAGAPPAPSSLHWRTVAAITALGVLGSGVAFILNYRVIRTVGVSTMATATYVMPIVAIALGAIVLRERLSWYQPTGVVVVLTGVALSQDVPGRLIAWTRVRRAARASQSAGALPNAAVT
jgi:drug/metabolite transporter (DMT)-like permease